MRLSARNQFEGTVKHVTRGNVMAEVVIELPGGLELVSAITRGSADRLALEPGQPVVAIVKSTDILVATP